jgi:lipopolysaccharide/colanic/teichoic acid biosynthesis glycosyltransferase
MIARASAIPLWKRCFDVFVAFVALIVASPLLLILALCVKLTLGKPVLFRQQRPGIGGRPFAIYKFRTMLRSDDMSVASDRHRISRFGGFLRRTSLDELPELWNVLRGEMSLVGPRPLLMQYVARYTPEQRRRQEVLPGITGWAQMHGRNAISWDDRFALDVWYVDHRSFWLDLRILALTIAKVLKRKGIAHPRHATMPEFMGSPQSDTLYKCHPEPCLSAKDLP